MSNTLKSKQVQKPLLGQKARGDAGRGREFVLHGEDMLLENVSN